MSQLALVESVVLEARPQFERVSVDRSVTFEREAAFAVQVIMGNEFTQRIALQNAQSVINAVSNVSAIGLTLNPAKRQAYLVPRDGRICLDIGYIGLLDMAIEGGGIQWGQGELVMDADKFTLNGVDQRPTHERNPFAKDRGPIVGAYVVAKTKAGDFLTTCMSVEELYSIRNRSQAWKQNQAGPWKTDPGEMMKKTVFKRAYKLWPKVDKLDRAIHYLNTEAEEGLPAIEQHDPVAQLGNLGLTPARYKVIRAVAGAALQRFNENNEWGAYEECRGIEDNDEKQALWSILKPHSSLRSAIKRLGLEESAKQAEMAKAFGETKTPAA